MIKHGGVLCFCICGSTLEEIAQDVTELISNEYAKKLIRGRARLGMPPTFEYGAVAAATLSYSCCIISEHTLE